MVNEPRAADHAPPLRWSLRIGTMAGIGVYVHATFLILLAWIAYYHWARSQSIVATLLGLGFILALFGCVLLHEMGHALMARRFGVPTRDITLLPIGGVARLQRMPERPAQELLVALAGPAVNVAIAIAIGSMILVTRGVAEFQKGLLPRGEYGWDLFSLNVMLVLFNLLPAFPMDGGRVLRAILATRIDYVRATQIAAGVGQAAAFVFGFIGLVYNPFLLFIALFVYLGAAHEASWVEARFAVRGLPAASAMVTNFRTLAREETLGSAVRMLLGGCQQDFPVMEDGHVVGILVRADLLRGLGEKGPDATVAAAMRTDFGTAEASEPLESVFERMQISRCPALPVVRDDRLVGIVTLENVGELMMVQGALRHLTDGSTGAGRRALRSIATSDEDAVEGPAPRA